MTTTYDLRGINALDKITNSTPCIICKQPVTDYTPTYCCNGTECACRGLPIEPPLCNNTKCTYTLFGGQNNTPKQIANLLHHYATQNTQEAEDKSADLIFQWTDDKSKQGNFHEINQLYPLINTITTHPAAIIALLMGTTRAAHEGHLPAREHFIQNIKHPELTREQLNKYSTTNKCPHCHNPLTDDDNHAIDNKRACNNCFYNKISNLFETHPIKKVNMPNSTPEQDEILKEHGYQPLRPSIKTVLNNYLELHPEPWQKREAIKQIITHLNTQLQNAFYPETKWQPSKPPPKTTSPSSKSPTTNSTEPSPPPSTTTKPPNSSNTSSKHDPTSNNTYSTNTTPQQP